MFEKGYTRVQLLALGMIQYRGGDMQGQCVQEGTGQSPHGEENQGPLFPCDQTKGKRVVQMKLVFDLAEERCEVVRAPNCFCFLNDEGGKITS